MTAEGRKQQYHRYDHSTILDMAGHGQMLIGEPSLRLAPRMGRVGGRRSFPDVKHYRRRKRWLG